MVIKNKFLNTAIILVAVIGMLLGVQSCGLIEPQDSEENTNQLPETIITSAPLQNSQFSYFVRIAWKGEDKDGIVKSYMLAVDDPEAKQEVTRTDSTFHFEADTTAEHTVWVAAVDDQGGIDPSPASLTFTATNLLPDTRIELDDNPPEGSTFGRAQKFTIIATDLDNGPEFSYRYKLDDGEWSQWLDDPIVEFYEGSPFGLLDPGEHTFYAQVRDAAMSVDRSPASYSFVVSTDVKPLAILTPTFNSLEFYPDSSVFYFENDTNDVEISWDVDASAYFGHYSAAKYSIDGGPFTEWLAIQDTVIRDLGPGVHTFILRVKDTGGIESDDVSFRFNMVAPTFANGVLVVDDGDGQFAGRPPATGDANVDGFYTDVLTSVGATITLWDIKTDGNLTPGNGFGNYSTVIWESDEAFLTQLPQKTRLVGEYLSLGGNLWIAGWKPLQQLGGGNTPVDNYSPDRPNAGPTYGFIWNYLKIASSKQSPSLPLPDFIGATGAEGYPTLNVDEAKNFLPTLANKLPVIDMFTLRSDVTEAKAIYQYISDSGAEEYQDEIVGMKYIGNDFKVVVFGFPFYHMIHEEAVAAATKIMTEFGEI